jgi:hypothetical protein
MKEADNKEIGDAAGMVMDAHNYIVQHRQPYRTAIVFDIQSDCKSDYILLPTAHLLRDATGAEFNLLSPESVIIPDTTNPFPVKTVASNTSVKWGTEESHDFQRQTLRQTFVSTQR